MLFLFLLFKTPNIPNNNIIIDTITNNCNQCSYKCTTYFQIKYKHKRNHYKYITFIIQTDQLKFSKLTILLIIKIPLHRRGNNCQPLHLLIAFQISGVNFSIYSNTIFIFVFHENIAPPNNKRIFLFYYPIKNISV